LTFYLLLIEVPSQLIICRPGLTFYLGPRDRFNLGEKYNSGIYLIGENKTKFNFNWVVKFQIDSRDIDSAFSKHIHVLAEHMSTQIVEKSPKCIMLILL